MKNINFKFSKELNHVLLFMMALGALGLVLGFVYALQRAWVVLLIMSIFYVFLSLSSLFFMALGYVTNSKWSAYVQKIPQAISKTMPLFSLALLLVLVGSHSLYHWTHAHDLNDPILNAKLWYLNIPFFSIRMILILLIWNLFVWLFDHFANQKVYVSEAQKKKVMTKLSVVFLFVFALSFSMASFDWIMSLEPHWFSTIFAVYQFSGMFVLGLSSIALVCILLSEMGVLQLFSSEHSHDFGKLIFAFVCFWAYIWYSQFVLIWYGNMPEETVYYVNRLQNDWDWLFYFNLLINFVIPFFVLLPRSAKRNPYLLKRVCVLLLVGRWFDLYLLIGPAVLNQGAKIGFVEVSVSLGFSACFVWMLKKKLNQRTLICGSKDDLSYSLHYHS